MTKGGDHMFKRLLVPIAMIALVLPACSGGDDGGIDVTLSDYQISLSEDSAAAGELTFNLQNEATQTHEFVIVKTDLAADGLPTNSEGDVDEEGEGMEPIDEVEDIEAGAEASLTVTLDAGKYVFICNLPEHYSQGMNVAFTVT